LSSVQLTTILEIYAVMFLGSVAFHALALLISMLLPKGASAGGIIAYLMLTAISAPDYSDGASVFSIHSLNPYYAFQLASHPRAGAAIARTVLTVRDPRDQFFGFAIDHSWVLILIFGSFGLWMLVAISRNIKREPEFYEVYSPGQAFGFMVYLNLILLGGFRSMVPAFIVDRVAPGTPPRFHTEIVPAAANDVESFFLWASVWLFGIFALAVLRNREQIRRRILAVGQGAGSWWTATWPMPFVIAGALLIGSAAVGIIRLKIDPIRDWTPSLGLLKFGFLAAWIVRDALYLQWMNLRRSRRPLVSAVLYLAIFYACVGAILVPLGWYEPENSHLAAMLLPSEAFQLTSQRWDSNTVGWIWSLFVLGCECLPFVWLQRRQTVEIANLDATIRTADQKAAIVS
jgi:hypothetical protein